MASITEATGLPGYISWNDTFTLPTLSIKFKLGSSETITNASTSYEKVKFLIGNFTTVAEAMENDIGSIVGSRDTTQNEYSTSFRTSRYGGGFTVAKGGTRTIQTYSTTNQGMTFYTNYSTPYDADRFKLSDDTYTNAKEYFTAAINKIDGGASRVYPITLLVEIGDATHTYRAVKSTSCHFVNTYINPTISTFTTSDTEEHDGLSHFGSYIYGVSTPRLAVNFALDPIDPTLHATHTLTVAFASHTKEYTAHTDAGQTHIVFDIDPINEDNFPGAFSGGQISSNALFHYTVTDNHGYTISRIKSVSVLNYSRPTIARIGTTAYIQRYGEITDDQGQTTYFIDELGTKLWVNLTATVRALSGINSTKNPWKIRISTDPSVPGTIVAQGTNGTTTTFTDDRTVLTGTYSAATQYSFIIRLEDYFGEVKVENIIVEKGSGYFDVEKTGVGVGMLSTSNSSNRKFEVANDYKSYFYGKSGFICDEDIELPSTGLFMPYSKTEDSGYRGVHIRSNGLMCELYGTISKKAEATSTTNQWVICHLPVGYYPSHQINILCQGSGTDVFMLRVDVDGAVSMARYRSGTTYGKVNSDTWLPFHVTWLI